MKFQASFLASILALSSPAFQAAAFCPARPSGRSLVAKSAVVDEPVTGYDSLTHDIISKLRFREARHELCKREMDASGTLSAMRERLRSEVAGLSTPLSSANRETRTIDKDSLDEAFENSGISFQDTSDPEFEYKDLVRQTMTHAEEGHWKRATRRLRTLERRYGRHSQNPHNITEDVYLTVLRSCMKDRLHGARAAEPARKILELMVDARFDIPGDVANHCVKNTLGGGPDGTHDGFGGIDTALAMLAAIEHSATPVVIQEDTYGQLVRTMAASGDLDMSIQTLRDMVVDRAMTPTLEVFADVALACVSGKDRSKADVEQVMTVLAYAKAAGYVLDSIASTSDGRRLLSAGVIAAEKLNNTGLGLRFLTAASKAQGCEPDSGDALVSTASPVAQRSATILHREAINLATKDNAWKLAVKLLDLMLSRGLTPSPSVWRHVVTCCAKAEKSRKATSLLMDWLELHKQGRAEKPPLRVFNTVVNACEVCGEEELTVNVLDAMQETHDTEGNLITFNIALKRLAKQGNTVACEGIIIGMLQNNIEPSVVTYTTAIAACVNEPKQSSIAMEWIRRMRSRLVQPNVLTYNTAFASCLDGTLAGSTRASQLAKEMVADIKKQLDSGITEADDYTNIIPNFYTRTLARQAMKQLMANWENGEIDRAVAKQTLRVPLLQLVEFLNTDLAEMAEQQKSMFTQKAGLDDETEAVVAEVDEELDYAAAISSHRAAAV